MAALYEIIAFESILYHLHGLYRFSETSGWRTAAHNEQVGGKPGSWHLVGLAKDLVPDADVDRQDFLTALRALGLHVLDEGDHIHSQAVPVGPPGEVA